MGRVVASSLLAPILAHPTSRLEILGSSSNLIWIALNGQAITIQTVRPGDSQALPTSIFLPKRTHALVTQIGLSRGRLAFGDHALEVIRWWQPPKAPIATSRMDFADPPSVGRLLGRGTGLTPEGDDILAGWLVMARSIRHPAFTSVLNEISRTSKMMTSTFSASLLLHAGAGYGVSPLIAYVNALLRNSKSQFVVREALTRVGHTSGEALAIGVELAAGLAGVEVPSITVRNQERAIA
jgi:hypothetical protein